MSVKLEIMATEGNMASTKGKMGVGRVNGVYSVSTDSTSALGRRSCICTPI